MTARTTLSAKSLNGYPVKDWLSTYTVHRFGTLSGKCRGLTKPPVPSTLQSPPQTQIKLPSIQGCHSSEAFRERWETYKYWIHFLHAQTYPSFFRSFVLSFLFLTSVYLIQGIETYCCSWSHSDTPHSVGFLWTSDQLVAETSTLQNTQYHQETNIHFPVGFEPEIPAS